jgi:uncharacterized protein YkwD
VTTAALGIALALSSFGHAAQLPVLGTAAPSSTEQTVAYVGSAQSETPRDRDVRLMLAALNAQRASRGLAPLELDPNLSKIASSYASEMATRNFFSHTSPEGDDPFKRMDRAGYRYGYAGENIALDQSPSSAAEALWHSPGHRENILEPHYQKVGIGAIASAKGEIFVEDFSD